MLCVLSVSYPFNPSSSSSSSSSVLFNLLLLLLFLFFIFLFFFFKNDGTVSEETSVALLRLPLPLLGSSSSSFSSFSSYLVFAQVTKQTKTLQIHHFGGYSKTHCKKLVTHVRTTGERSESARDRRIAL